MVFIFTTALSLMPLSLRINGLQSVDITEYMPSLERTMTADFLAAYQDFNWDQVANQGQSSQEDDKVRQAFVKDESQAETLLKEGSGLAASQDQVFIKEGDQPIFVQDLGQDNPLLKSQDPQMVLKDLSQLWFKDNRLSLIVIQLLNVAIILFTNNLIFIGVVSALVYLMHLSRRFTIGSYKEALTIVLNAFGGASLLAMIAAFAGLDPLAMISLQGFAFIASLMASYWKTHFNDDYLEDIQKRGAHRGRN